MNASTPTTAAAASRRSNTTGQRRCEAVLGGLRAGLPAVLRGGLRSGGWTTPRCGLRSDGEGMAGKCTEKA